jgi:excinuclease ABC subunit A
VVIEHNLDVIKIADYIIDLGPEGGNEGGYIVAEGTPEEVCASGASFTGQYLRAALAAAGASPGTAGDCAGEAAAADGSGKTAAGTGAVAGADGAGSGKSAAGAGTAGSGAAAGKRRACARAKGRASQP